MGNGGDGGIRTLDRALQPYNGLANRRLQPLGHVSKRKSSQCRGNWTIRCSRQGRHRRQKMRFVKAQKPGVGISQLSNWERRHFSHLSHRCGTARRPSLMVTAWSRHGHRGRRRSTLGRPRGPRTEMPLSIRSICNERRKGALAPAPRPDRATNRSVAPKLRVIGWPINHKSKVPRPSGRRKDEGSLVDFGATKSAERARMFVVLERGDEFMHEPRQCWMERRGETHERILSSSAAVYIGSE